MFKHLEIAALGNAFNLFHFCGVRISHFFFPLSTFTLSSLALASFSFFSAMYAAIRSYRAFTLVYRLVSAYWYWPPEPFFF